MSQYSIADHIITLDSKSGKFNFSALLPSLRPFEMIADGAEPLFHMVIESEDEVASDCFCNDGYVEVGDFDTGNGHTKVEKNDATGEYIFTIRNIEEKEVCYLYTNADYTGINSRLVGDKMYWSYGLNSALMLTYAFSAAKHMTLLIHASCVKQGDYAYAFIAKSGTGKSTQVSNWLKHLPGCELLNDDNPIVRIIDNTAYIYGSPWSGKTPCYRNRKALLGAITRIERADHNKVEKLSPIEAFTSMLPSCSTMKWENKLYNDVMDAITKIVETSNLYALYCLPDKESAIVCHEGIAINN